MRHIIIIYLLNKEIKEARKRQSKSEYSFVKRAYGDAIKSYKNTIEFIEATGNNK